MRRQKRTITLQSSVGAVKIEIDYGQQARGGQWLCPQSKEWGLSAHQKMTPALTDRLCFTATMCGSYEGAAQLAGKWGCPADDSTLHALVQRVGDKAQKQMDSRLKTLPQESAPARKPTELGVLLADGWQVRHRGPGWGAKRTKNPRVEWHEMKMGVYYQTEQVVDKNARVQLVDKTQVSTLGEPMELGQKLGWEAARAGIARAKHLLMLGDGAHWIWNLKKDRWKNASELLDFYHASEHLWSLGRALAGEAKAPAWVEPRLHKLRHGKQEQILKEITRLKAPGAAAPEAVETIDKEQTYFAGQKRRMEYKRAADRGWPIGSGAVESACRQQQCRFKRPGQFWTAKGLKNLSALTDAKHNHHWEELWQAD